MFLIIDHDYSNCTIDTLETKAEAMAVRAKLLEADSWHDLSIIEEEWDDD